MSLATLPFVRQMSTARRIAKIASQSVTGSLKNKICTDWPKNAAIKVAAKKE